MLHLAAGRPGRDRHVLVFVTPADVPDGAGPVAERLAGYGHLDPTDAVQGSSAEVVVHPELRGLGVGRLLVGAVQELSPDGRLRLWAHGQQSAAAALARSMGYTSERELLQLRRSLRAALPEVELPPGYRLRSFVPGQDDDAWLAVNAAAFADHPEQGRWTRDDLASRLAEDWFDPDGFLLLDGPDGDLAGFH